MSGPDGLYHNKQGQRWLMYGTEAESVYKQGILINREEGEAMEDGACAVQGSWCP
jgi:hypothetical protein